MDVGRHVSLFRVVTGQLQCPFVDIGPDDPLGKVRPDEVTRLLAHLLPKPDGDRLPRLGRELPVQARRDIPADQGRLDRNRARAAERVDQRSLRIPIAQQHQAGGQSLAQGGLADQSPVAAPVQAAARSCRA